jgi:hypothetical protein
MTTAASKSNPKNGTTIKSSHPADVVTNHLRAALEDRQQGHGGTPTDLTCEHLYDSKLFNSNRSPLRNTFLLEQKLKVYFVNLFNFLKNKVAQLFNHWNIR